MTAHHPWLTKSAQFREDQHKRDAGEFLVLSRCPWAGEAGWLAWQQPKGVGIVAGRVHSRTAWGSSSGLTRQRIGQMSPAAVADMARRLGYQGETNQSDSLKEPSRPQPPPLPPQAVAAAQKIGQAAVGKPIQAIARQLGGGAKEVQQAFAVAAKLTERDTPERVIAKVDATR